MTRVPAINAITRINVTGRYSAVLNLLVRLVYGRTARAARIGFETDCSWSTRMACACGTFARKILLLWVKSLFRIPFP
jgi:hypothetical protein